MIAIAQRGLDFLMILDGNSWQRDQMRNTIDDLAGRLPGNGPQHPFELEYHGLWNENVAGGQDAIRNARLRYFVVQVIASEHVGINRAHARPPFSLPIRHAYPEFVCAAPCSSEWPGHPRCAKAHRA